MSRAVQWRDPISPFLFVIQIAPFCEMTDNHNGICGISVSENNIMPTGSCFADDLIIIAKLAKSVCHIYTTVEQYFRKNERLLHPDRCVAVLVPLYPWEMLPNGIQVSTGRAHNYPSWYPRGIKDCNGRNSRKGAKSYNGLMQSNAVQGNDASRSRNCRNVKIACNSVVCGKWITFLSRRDHTHTTSHHLLNE